MAKLLLGSGGLSTLERREAWKKELDSFMGPIRKILFVPYAGADHAGYLTRWRELDFAAGRTLEGIHETPDPVQAVASAQAIFVGGGNTFRLLADLYRHDLIEIIQKRVREGMPYAGISAGTNVACPTMKTTNDMPITYPPSLSALRLVPFQINPHYFAGAVHYESPHGFVRYGGETRDDRIREFHEMNSAPVLGLWEGAIARIEGDKATLLGTSGARLFRRGHPPEDRLLGADLSDLL